MAIFQLNNGVRIAGNDPIDYDRYIADDLTARDQLITDGRAYVGLQVYVSGVTNKLYILKDFTPTWEEVGGAADISSLSTVISIETSNRISGDISLSTAITNIPTYDDSSLSTVVSTEISHRTSGDLSLSTAISSVSGNTFDIDSIMDNGEVLGMVGGELTGVTYSTIVSTEASIRLSVDQSLSTTISIEISDRTSGDLSLSTAVSTKLSGLTSDILFWNSATTAYTPYLSSGVTGTAGKFYLGNNFIPSDDLRLNYTGGIYSNSSLNYGIYGQSDLVPGVYGESGIDAGVKGVSSNGIGGSFSSNSLGLRVGGNSGVGAWIDKSGILLGNDANHLLYLTRTNSGIGLDSIGDIINIVDNPTVTGYISGSTLKATIDSIIRIDMNPRVANSGTSVAYIFDTNTNLIESGATLLALRNFGNNKFTVDKDGMIDVYNNNIINVSTPILDSDAANKGYVDAIAQGISVHEPVHVVTTGSTTLSGETTIDGYSLVEGEFVLVAGQSNGAENGIYVVHSGGTGWTRRPDADGDPTNEIELGDFVFILSGMTYNNTGWALGRTDAPTGQTYIIPGVDTQEWFKMAAPGSYTTDGLGIEILANEFSLELDGTTLYKSTSGLKLDNALSTSISESATGITSLSTALSGEISNRTSHIESLSTSISEELSSSMDSLSTTISENISTGNDSLSTVISENISTGNDSLSTAISINISTADASLSTILSTSISIEASNRVSGDESLASAIGSGGIIALSGLTDVSISSPQDNDVLVWISADNLWENRDSLSGITSLSTVLSIEISDRVSEDTSLSTAIDSKLSGLTSDLLFWNSGTSSYTPYSSNITAGTAGKFYSGTTFVTAADKRLNYTGGLSVNSISNASIHGYSTSYTGIYGLSDTNSGVMGVSTSGVGGYFTTTSYRGVQIEGGSGIGAWIMKSTSLSGNDSNNLLYISRQTTGNFNKTGDIININDSPLGTGTVSGSILKATIDSTIRVNINPRVSDGASAVAYMFDTNTGLTITGAKLVSIKNYGVEKFYIDYSGNAYANGTLLAGAVAFTLGTNTRLGGGSSWGSNSQTTVVGYNAGNALGVGSDNSFFGNQAGKSVTTCSYNSIFGSDAGYSLTGGTGSNVIIGYRAGYTSVSGSSNIFIGNNAGYNELGSNKLYISNTSTSTPLIGGDFVDNTVTINGILTASNIRKISLITLTSGGTTTWDMNNSCSARLYLTGATTLSISNAVSGDNGTLIVIQGTTGNITFPSGSKYAGGTGAPTLSGSGQLDILSFYYDGTNYYWNIGKNYTT